MGPVLWKRCFSSPEAPTARLPWKWQMYKVTIIFQGGKDSFLSLPDGLQQKDLERLVSCRNQSSTCHIICWLSLVGLGSYLVFGLACRHKRLLEMEKRRKRDRKALSPFSIKCPVYRQSEEGRQMLHKSMRPETRWFFFKSDLSALGGYLSRSAWHLWLKFRKGVKLSVQNKKPLPKFWWGVGFRLVSWAE